MSKPNDILLEVNELVQAMLDESIDDENMARLTQLLESSPEARALYDQLITVHVGLNLEHQRDEWERKLGIQDETKSDAEPEPVDLRLVVDQLAAEEESEATKDQWENPLPGHGFIDVIGRALPSSVQDAFGSFSFGIGALAISVSLFVLLVILLIPSGEMETGPVALVTQSVDAVWAGDSGELASAEVQFGQQLNLKSGLVQIKYQNGIRVNLEGPTHFIVSGDDQGILVRGKISALAKNVPAGFTVKTPVGRVVDLGTEFGIKVTDNHDTEVQVFEGLVRLDIDRPASQGGSATMPAQSLELCRGEAVQVDAMLRTVQPVSYLPDQFARTYEELQPYYFEDFKEDIAGQFVGTFSVWGEEVGAHAVMDGALVAEVESCAYAIFSREKLLKANEIVAVDVPATKPGLDVFVVLSTEIGEQQGGPDGGVGFRLRRDHGKGIVVQQSDSNRCFPIMLDGSLTDDPCPDQPLRLVIERSSEAEFTFYYEMKGDRVKIFGPVHSQDLADVEGLYIGFEVSSRDIQPQSVTFDNFSIRPASK